MDSGMSGDARSIFCEALDHDSDEGRLSHILDACGGNQALCEEVLRLIGDLGRAAGFLERPAGPFSPSDAPEDDPLVGSVIGRYTVRKRLGEGGWGVVYEAEESGSLPRRVALKVVRPGMDTRRVLDRFELERRTLARMSHPNIATVFDAGATADGRPYFAMELVPGERIDRYCDRAGLTVRERIGLFLAVCGAIQHAHLKGIIHRDIKPSNVLVAPYEGAPVAKVIDFGIAKAVEASPGDRPGLTQVEEVMGTYEYMSPEQATPGNDDIDTRTDVYSLGVLLYVLLTGTVPLLRLRRDAGHRREEVLRRVRDEVPPRPSARLATLRELGAIEGVAARRGADAARLHREVRGDLDWIVMKAIEKDRDRRYATAIDLARDLERSLARRPVEAGPPSWRYRLGRYVRRHRTRLAITGLLAAATAVSVGMAARARREASRATEAAEVSEKVQNFFRDRVLAAARPTGRAGGLGPGATVRQALDAAEPTIAAEFAGRPAVEGAVRDALGITYFYLGAYDPAIRQLERALALREGRLGPEHVETLATLNNLGQVYLAAGRADDAVRIHAREWDATRRARGPEHPAALGGLSNLAVALRRAGRNDLAVPILERVYRRRRATLGPGHPDTLVSTGRLAGAYVQAGRVEEALPLLRADFEATRAARGPGDDETLSAQGGLAAALVKLRRYDEAIPMLTELVRLREHARGASHPHTLTAMTSLADAYKGAGRPAAAIEHHRRVLELRREHLPPDHPDTIASLRFLGVLFMDARDWPRAEEFLLEAHAALRRHAAKAPSATAAPLAAVRRRLVSLYESWGRPEEAAPYRDPAP